MPGGPIIGPLNPWAQQTTNGPLLPTTRRLPTALLTGCSIGLFPSNNQYVVELQRSTQNSTGAGSSSKWGTERYFGRGANTEIIWNSIFPLSTRPMYWRARQTMVGWNNGPWTTVLRGRPVYLDVNRTLVPGFGSTALRAHRTISTGDATLVPTIVGQPQTITASRYRCFAGFTGALSIANATPQNIGMNTESVDVGNIHDTVTNNDRFVIPATHYLGTWFFIAGVTWAANATGYREIVIQDQAANVVGWVRTTATSAGDQLFQQVTAMISDPNPGDYYVLNVNQTSGGNLNVVTALMRVAHVW